MYYLLQFSLEKKPQKKTNIKCNVIKITIYIQGELDLFTSQFTFKVNSIDSLQGIEIEIHG
jgi:histidyl-tRNA synthetase